MWGGRTSSGSTDGDARFGNRQSVQQQELQQIFVSLLTGPPEASDLPLYAVI